MDPDTPGTLLPFQKADYMKAVADFKQPKLKMAINTHIISYKISTIFGACMVEDDPTDIGNLDISWLADRCPNISHCTLWTEY